MTPPRPSVAYMPQMDGLRAIAVLAVLYHHWLMPAWPVGHWGVRLFFVISGYLITRTIVDLKENEFGLWPSARQFFVRRSLRLFPAYYLTVLVGAFLYPEVRARWPWYLAYLSNILMVVEQRWIALTPSWSLAIEEQFYLAWFFVVMFVHRGPRLILLWAMVIIAPLLRLDAFVQDNQFLLLTLWAQFDALAAGALLFEAERRAWRLPPRASPTLVFALLGALAMLAAWLLPALTSVAALVMFALAVWLARDGFDSIAGAALRHPLIVQVGKISYGIYLYHMVVPALMDWLATGVPGLWRLLTPNSVTAFVIHSAATLTLAQFSFSFFEQPIRKSVFGVRLAVA